MITNKFLTELNGLSLEEKLKIFRICADDLGLVDMHDAEMLLGKNKRTIYLKMNESNSEQVGIHKLPFINLML